MHELDKTNMMKTLRIKVDGECITRPNQVKNVFFDHFRRKFKNIPSIDVVNKSPHLKALTKV
ncbi:hypothetical protein LXL04_029123 [Taraxacum kok-saghyz]